jgi:hypothetical protein
MAGLHWGDGLNSCRRPLFVDMMSHNNEEADMTYRRRRIAYPTVAEQPIATVNTTPLIDVMLVLLIMFIITIPIMTHSVKIDIPQGPPPAVPVEPETHQLALDSASRLTWDGAAIAEKHSPPASPPFAPPARTESSTSAPRPIRAMRISIASSPT